MTDEKCFTSLPNIVFDDLMPTMTGNEFKVYLAIWRSSWGWNSETCTLSYDQLATAAAVSVSTAIRSIDELEGRGLVTVTRTSTRDIHSSNVYRLNPPPNISPSSEPEPAQAMTAMTAIEPEPATAGVTDTHPTHNLPGGGGDFEELCVLLGVTEPEPIPATAGFTHPTHNLPGGGMNAAAILNHLMNRHFNERMISSYEKYANPRRVAIPSSTYDKIMALLTEMEEAGSSRAKQIRGEMLSTRRVTGAD